MKYKIRFFSSFGNPNECGKILDRLCETSLMENFGKDKEIEITVNDDYTHVIILNTAMPTIPKHIDKKNVIGPTSSIKKGLVLVKMYFSMKLQFRS